MEDVRVVGVCNGNHLDWERSDQTRLAGFGRFPKRAVRIPISTFGIDQQTDQTRLITCTHIIYIFKFLKKQTLIPPNFSHFSFYVLPKTINLPVPPARTKNRLILLFRLDKGCRTPSSSKTVLPLNH
ncbi:hypothetical protein EUGRSUZ_C03708 [Eucalyptus grandis]|uniref:Uncharacterized protein n=2 Tax=Eucalyptus grandis TaxID=71139 RepID=A0ACC3LJ24_EUCGR|nr:hypothetical protein EUGRSUZ_C03708 [Eucalyptus grandis]